MLETVGPPPLLISGFAQSLETPALLVDLAVCRKNIAETLERVGSPGRWRPHVKTAKIPEAMALYLEAGVFNFKCATVREAEVLAKATFADFDAEIPVRTGD